MGWSAFRPTGLTHHDTALSYKGYTLFAPLGGDSAYLVDMSGRIVHRWRVPGFRLICPKLAPDGHLFVLAADASEPAPPRPSIGDPIPAPPTLFRLIGANATDLLELEWDGSIAWRYSNPAIHHDFIALPNGNFVLPEFAVLPPEVARRVRGGVRQPREKLPPLISDDFIEVTRQSLVVDRIHLWQLLDPRDDPMGPLEQRWEWTHTNGLDLTSEGHLVFSCRQNSRIGIIDRASRTLLWKYGAPNTHHQHNPTVLQNGNILVFDNGMNRLHGLSYSRVVEVNPRDDSIAWEYTANPREQFFSGHISGAQRLPNGNTLVCEGTSGRIFEVTQGSEIAWEWINPIVNWRGSARIPWLFRAYRYGPDHPAVARRDLDPAKHASLNRLHGLE